MHSSWDNNHNLFRQVGLISINVQGEYENKVNDFNNNINNNLEENKNVKNENENTFEDNIKYDPVTLNKLKNLTSMKDEAISQEDYDKAQIIKNAINRLKSVANQLLVLEERKQIAIKNEQFDQAKVLKFEIEALRDEVSNIDYLKNNNNNYSNQVNQRKPTSGNNTNTGFNKLKKNTNSNQDMNNFNNNDMNNNIQQYDNYENTAEIDEMNNNENNFNNQRGKLSGSKTPPIGKDVNYLQNTKNKFENNMQEKDPRSNLNTPLQNQNLSNYDNNNSTLKKNKSNTNFNNNSNKQGPVDVDKIQIKNNNQNFDDLLNEKMKEEKLNKKGKNSTNNNNLDENADDNEDIPEKEYPIAEPFIGIFSYDYVKLLFSKNWKKKEEGLKLIEKEITKYPKSTIIDSNNFGVDSLIYSSFGVAEYILANSLPQPCIASLDILKIVLNKYKNDNTNKLGSYKNDFISKVEKIAGLLLEKTADANPKLKEKAELTINDFADSGLIGPKIILNYIITGKVKKSLVNSAKHLMSRLNLLDRNIDSFGADPIEDIDALVKFALNGFKNPNKDVRDSAFNLIMNIYKYIGEDVKKHFKDLRPAQVSTLEEGFDGVEFIGNNKKGNNKNSLINEKGKNAINTKNQTNQGNSSNLEMSGKNENNSVSKIPKSAKGKSDNRKKSTGKNSFQEQEMIEGN